MHRKRRVQKCLEIGLKSTFMKKICNNKLFGVRGKCQKPVVLDFDDVGHSATTRTKIIYWLLHFFFFFFSPLYNNVSFTITSNICTSTFIFFQ